MLFSSNMVKFKFNEICLENSTFISWLEPVVENNKIEALLYLVQENAQIRNFEYKGIRVAWEVRKT